MESDNSGSRDADTKEIVKLKEQIFINPDDANAHHNLGYAYLRLVKHREAVQEFKEAIRIKSDYAEAHNNLGITYFHLSNYQESVQEFKEAIRIKSDYAMAHSLLADTYMILEDGANAIVHKLIAAKLFERAGDFVPMAYANRRLRELYTKYDFKPEDFDSVNIPDSITEAPKHKQLPPQHLSPR